MFDKTHVRYFLKTILDDLEILPLLFLKSYIRDGQRTPSSFIISFITMEESRVPMMDITQDQEQQTRTVQPPPPPPPQDPYNEKATLEWLDNLIAQHLREIEQQGD